MASHQVIVYDIPKRRMSANLSAIVRNTADTWQKGRSSNERAGDATIGKTAEEGFEQFLKDNKIPYRTWDTMRNDDFREHSSLDGFIAHTSSADILNSDDFLQQARQAKPTNSSYFDPSFFSSATQRGIFAYEVKSTRIAARHLKNNNINYDKILGDDFLVYPKIRSGNITERLVQELKGSENIKEIKSKTPNFLIRAYVEDKQQLYRVHLIGWINREDFFSSERLTVKGMFQPGKSEKAIYYTVPLKYAHSLDEFPQIFLNN